MRVLVLTAEAAPELRHGRATVTKGIVETLESSHVSHTLVHPTQLLRELTLGPHVALLVVDAESTQPWLAELFGELRRRVLVPSRPAVVVIGERIDLALAPRMFASGIINWLSPRRTAQLLDYWHWVCCQHNAEMGGNDTARRRAVLQQQCAGRSGTLELGDRRLHARLKVSDGRLGFPRFEEFESGFSRAVRRFVSTRFLTTKSRATSGAEPRGDLICRGQWDEVLVRDAIEQYLQSTLRWFFGTAAQTRFVESDVSVPTELLWRPDDLVDDGPLSRHGRTKSFSMQQLALVANDTALADVS